MRSRALAAACCALTIVLPAAASARTLVIDQPSRVPWPTQVPVSAYLAIPGGTPRGVIVDFHGGGWARVDPHVEDQRLTLYANQGYVAVAPDMRPYLGSLVDAITVAEAVRRVYGANMPICVFGGSTGANLALLVAEQLPDIACVIAYAPITDIRALASSRSPIYSDAVSNLTPSHLSDFSPALHARLLGNRPVLLVAAANDPQAPIAQAQEMQRADPQHTELTTLDPGSDPVFWVHSTVSAAAYAAEQRSEPGWISSAMAGWSKRRASAVAAFERCVRQQRRKPRRRRLRCAMRSDAQLAGVPPSAR